jgi:hypothetical protein
MRRLRSPSTAITTVAWTCLLLTAIVRGSTPEQTPASAGWPRQMDGRKLRNSEYGFVYARETSALKQVQETLGTVAEDLKRDGAGALPAGLVLVVDTKEKHPLDLAKLIEVLKEKDPNDSKGKLKEFEGMQKQCQELGVDSGTILSLVPIPIPEAELHAIIEDFPPEVGPQIGWCVIVPTEGCMKMNLKQMIDAGIRKEKPGLMKRATIAAMKPLIERQMMSMMKKAGQAMLYEHLLSTQKDLSPEQRKAKVGAYKEKLGLNKAMDPNEPQKK